MIMIKGDVEKDVLASYFYDEYVVMLKGIRYSLEEENDDYYLQKYEKYGDIGDWREIARFENTALIDACVQAAAFILKSDRSD